MKKILLVMLVMITIVLSANEIDEIRFAIGLYSDGKYDFAKPQLESFIAKYPQSNYINEANFMLANIYFKNSEYQKAIKIYEQLKRDFNNPKVFPDIILNLAQSYFYLDKNNSNTEPLLDSFIAKYKSNNRVGTAYFIKAKILFEKKQYEQALQFSHLAKNNYPKQHLDFLECRIHLALDDYEKASKSVQNLRDHKKLYAKSVIRLQTSLLQNKLYDKNIAVYGEHQLLGKSELADTQLEIMGITFFEKNEYQQALNLFEQMKETTDISEYYTASIEMNLGNSAEAEKTFKKLANSKNNDIATNSRFYLAKISGEKNADAAISQLQDFIKNNPNHKFIYAANYQLGLNYYKLENYAKAQEYLEKADNSKMDTETKIKTDFLLAETYFKQNFINVALENFEKVARQNTAFADEAYFKIGLIHFQQNDFPKAFSAFDTIIKKYPDSEKLGQSYYYLGEIYFFKNQYLIALDNYQIALDNFSQKENMIKQRMAEIYYFQNKLQLAMQTVEEIEQSPENEFSFLLLKGNIYFAQKEEEKSLQIYKQADNIATSKKQKNIIKTKLARNFYRLKKYDEAAKLFAELGKDMNDEQYLLMTANSYFKNEKYDKAIEAYQNILSQYPQTDKKKDIEQSIADSYYNKSDFGNANENYAKILTEYNINDEAVVNGYFWSLSQIDSVDVENEVNQLLQNIESEVTKNQVRFRFAQTYFEKGENEKAFALLTKISPSYRKKEVLFQKVKILVKQEKFDDAQSLLQQADKSNFDAKIYQQWSEIYALQNQNEMAIDAMKKALIKDNDDEQLKLQLLQLLKDANSDEFESTYNKFVSDSQPLNKAKAELIFVDWKISNKKYEDVDEKIAQLLQSDFEVVRARAQFFKGKSLFENAKFKAAVIELLRIRYLYPKYDILRIKAEYLACLGYLELNQPQDAAKIYETIADKISAEEKDVYQQKLANLPEEK